MYVDHFPLIAKSKRTWLGRKFSAETFNAAVLLLQFLLIVLLASATGHAYHLAVYGNHGDRQDFASIGALVALLYLLPQAYDAIYRSTAPPRSNRELRRVFASWNLAFVCIFLLAFLTKSSSDFSRGWMLLFYIAGSTAIIASEVAILAFRRAAIGSGQLTTRRLFVVGSPVDVTEFARRCAAEAQGIEIVGAADISEFSDKWSSPEQSRVSLRKAIALARGNNVSDIVILTSWSEAPAAARIAERFLDVPAAVHLNGLDVVEQFSQLGIDHLGTSRTFVIRPQPLSTLQAAMKRVFDISVAGVALLAIAPLLAAIALMIKLDTRGPAIFVQRRRGFNHREFNIYKFRTMTTADDGDRIAQATRNDPRITPIGRILRKYNIDELPQLVNVLLGQMSLVGPRPHAVAHDRYYEQVISRYGRRLNVRPGITGWAQINGLRGETKTQAAMEARLDRDLYYIDNWSVVLDIYILLMTIISRRAYRNAV